METTVTDRIIKLREIKGVSVNNFIGGRYASEFEDALKRYREWGDVSSFSVEGYVNYCQQPSRGIILAVIYTEGMGRYVGSIEYAFLTSDGRVLPDPECCGRIDVRKPERLDECLRILYQGFVPM